MTRIDALSTYPTRYLKRVLAASCAASFVAGFVCASVLPNAIKADAAVTLPQPVVAQIRELTEHWCRNFGGLDKDRLYLVGPKMYSWWCNEYASYHGVRIHTRGGKE